IHCRRETSLLVIQRSNRGLGTKLFLLFRSTQRRKIYCRSKVWSFLPSAPMEMTVPPGAWPNVQQRHLPDLFPHAAFLPFSSLFRSFPDHDRSRLCPESSRRLRNFAAANGHPRIAQLDGGRR